MPFHLDYKGEKRKVVFHDVCVISEMSDDGSWSEFKVADPITQTKEEFGTLSVQEYIEKHFQPGEYFVEQTHRQKRINEKSGSNGLPYFNMDVKKKSFVVT